MQSFVVTRPSSPSSSELPAPVIQCTGLTKQFYLYEHRTRSLRELFIRGVLRQPFHVATPYFALSGVDLTVRRGEAVALIGTNGSGKSTILRLLAGIYTPSSGTIEVDGTLAAVLELGAGFHPELTGAANLALYGAALGFTRREIRERFDDIVAFAELGEFINTPVKYYSSGMVARLAFSVAVCVEPDVLLLDEVLAVGDEGFRSRCLDRLHSFHARAGEP